MIRIVDLDKFYGNKQLFNRLNGIFEKGTSSTILGPSGCGKTTLLRLIAGFEKPDSGVIYIDQNMVSSPKYLVPPRFRGINMVFQNLALWPHMTAYQHLAFLLKSTSLSKSNRRERINWLLQLVDLKDHTNKYPSQLSGGEQQRLAIARALALENPILLLDEPFAHIHFDLKREIQNLILKIKLELDLTLICVTHLRDDTHVFADKIYYFSDMTLEQESRSED